MTIGSSSTSPTRPALRLETLQLETDLVPSPATYMALLPPDHSAAGGPYPLVLLLHGGDGYQGFLAGLRAVIEDAWAAGELPPAVIVTPNAQRSLYMDYRDGSQRWESFILQELIPDVRRRFHVSSARSKTVVAGMSMGGLGALRLAFDHPETFGGLAALEAGIDPVFSFDELTLRHRWYRDDGFLKEVYGDPIDRDYWRRFNPASMVLAQRDKIVASELQIYIEVGDRDMVRLDEGVEFLHRVLWDHEIDHEYRLVRGADHVGRTIPGRFRDGFRFLTQHVLEPPPPEVIDKARVEELQRRAGYSDTGPRPPLRSTSP